MTIKSIVFGAGCFWCTEAIFKMFKGVINVIPGYAGGFKDDPTYEEVCSGNTGHAEVVKIEYDDQKIKLDFLIEIFLSIDNPKTINHNEHNFSDQYRSIILYSDNTDLQMIKNIIDSKNKDYKKPIDIEIKKLDKFYPAENYHIDYYRKNPLNPYCIFVARPKIEKIKKKYNL